MAKPALPSAVAGGQSKAPHNELQERRSAPKGLRDTAQPAHFVPPKGTKNIARAVAGPAPPRGCGTARETKDVAKNQHGR